MKNIKLWLLVCLILMKFEVSAQMQNTEGELKKIQIAYSKTTSLVFPYAIKSVDKGSQEILIQKAKGVENILLVKAGKQNFTQTNLTIVTADGKLYGFVVSYDEQCPDLNLIADNGTALNQDILFSLDNENHKIIKQYAELALAKKKKVSGLNKKRFDVSLHLTGLFIHQDVMYFRISLGNKSKINYDIDQLRFFIRDQKKSTRTASQEIEMHPLLSTSQVEKVFDQSEVAVVFAFSKFTIPDKKYLTIQMIERGGGRQIELNIKNYNLIHLEVLNSL